MKDIQQTDDLDSSTMSCPCGESFKNDSYTTVREMQDWLKKHTPHSSGYISGFISDDGMRCLTKDSPRSYRRKL